MAVVEDFPDIEAVRDARPIELAAREARRAAARAAGLPSPAVRVPSAGGEVGINRLLSRLRHAINFAVEEGYIEHSPFYRGSRLVVRPTREQDRTRRLEPGEEQRLLLAANPHLQGLIIAAVSTGCRVGELLSLQWSQVRLDAAGRPRVIELPASKTKTNEARMIPVGQRLAAVLAIATMGPTASRTVRRATFWRRPPLSRLERQTAWRATCKRAGIVGLRFHDLRREFGSRLIESGADLHDVREVLGHANISMTSRYLRSTTDRLTRALAKLEAFDVPPAVDEVASRTEVAQNASGAGERYGYRHHRERRQHVVRA